MKKLLFLALCVPVLATVAQEQEAQKKADFLRELTAVISKKAAEVKTAITEKTDTVDTAQVQQNRAALAKGIRGRLARLEERFGFDLQNVQRMRQELQRMPKEFDLAAQRAHLNEREQELNKLMPFIKKLQGFSDAQLVQNEKAVGQLNGNLLRTSHAWYLDDAGVLHAIVSDGFGDLKLSSLPNAKACSFIQNIDGQLQCTPVD